MTEGDPRTTRPIRLTIRGVSGAASADGGCDAVCRICGERWRTRTMEEFTVTALGHRCGAAPADEHEGTPRGSGEEEARTMGLIMSDDIKAMRDSVKEVAEAATAMRGALIAAENGSDAFAVRTILLDSIEVAQQALSNLDMVASVQPRQQSLTVQEQVDMAEQVASALTGETVHRRKIRRQVEAEEVGDEQEEATP